MSRIKTKLGRFIGTHLKDHQRGIAAVEFALICPFLFTILLGGMDAAYFLLISQRVDRICYTITDLVTQQQSLAQTDLDNIFLAANQLMRPLAATFSTNGYVVVSSVYRASGSSSASILWQYDGKTGTKTSPWGLAAVSKISVTGSTLNIPDPSMPSNSVALNSNDNVIVVETFYAYTPLFASWGIFKAGTLYRSTVFKPRLSALTTKPS